MSNQKPIDTMSEEEKKKYYDGLETLRKQRELREEINNIDHESIKTTRYYKKKIKEKWDDYIIDGKYVKVLLQDGNIKTYTIDEFIKLVKEFRSDYQVLDNKLDNKVTSGFEQVDVLDSVFIWNVIAALGLLVSKEYGFALIPELISLGVLLNKDNIEPNIKRINKILNEYRKDTRWKNYFKCINDAYRQKYGIELIDIVTEIKSQKLK